eukprot:gene11314-12624_t
MGNSLLKSMGSSTLTMPSLLQETQIFSLWTIEDVRELLKRFRNQIHGFALVEAQFETIMSFKPSVAEYVELETLFAILDNDHDGRIDGLELLGGLALCCHASFEDKARFCFELFDFNLNSLLSKKEMVMMMMSSVFGMNILTGGREELEPGLEVFEALAEDAMLRADLNCDGQISYDEFLLWARSNRELMAGLEGLNRISLQAKLEIQSDDSAPEEESDSETDDEGVLDLSYGKTAESLRGDQSLAIVPWLGQIAEPTNYKPRKRDSSAPETNLKLAWAFGYHATSSVNNVRYLLVSGTEEMRVIYPIAAVCVLYNTKLRCQNFYLGHAHEITSLTLHPNQQIAATGDCKSNIHIWTLDAQGQPVTLSIIQGLVKVGIQLMAFAPSGDRLATVGMDLDHTVCIFDTNTGEVISSAKGMSSPSVTYDVAYSDNGTELALVGKNQVKFFINVHTNKRALDSKIGRIGKGGKRQAFYSVAYIKSDAVVGCASGEIYRFKDGQCIAMVQAHGVKEAVLCLFYNRLDGTLLSGGRDNLIKAWDSSLKEIGSAIDLSEDLDGDGVADNGSLNSAVISLHQMKNNVLVGTRGCDIFEVLLGANPGQSHSLTRIAWGHSSGELWGLAVHPSRDEIATVGDDRTIRIWSLRSHEQVSVRVMPCAARSLAYSANGEIICIGMTDGGIALLEANNPKLRVYSTWNHSHKAINDIKFSPDGTYLAIASADTNIYLYKSEDRKSFKRQAVCRGHSGAVTHIDFSASSQYLQSNSTDYSLLYWDISGNQIKQSFSMRDTIWASFTCVLGWPVQGIWPKGSDYTDVNACQALLDVGDIITGDDFHRVNLYRYPSVKQGAVRQSYIGHASHVTCVRFNWNHRYAVSTGGLDRSILIWKHDAEIFESDEELAGSASSGSSGGEEDALGVRNYHPHVAPRSIEQEAANLGWSEEEMQAFVKQTKNSKAPFSPDRGDQSESKASVVPPWKSCVIESSNSSAPPIDTTDVDASLVWVHGVRSNGCRNNILYSAEGSIVYNAATLAVAYQKLSGKQQFLHGPHTDEVIGIGIHPTGQIFATGEAGRNPSIVVWNSKDMNVLARIEGAHGTGVALLAFNPKGNILASIGLDEDNSLCIHDWSKTALLLKTPTDKGKILSCCFLYNDIVSNNSPNRAFETKSTDTMSTTDCDILVTGGLKCLRFWWFHGQNIQSQKAIWGNEKEEKSSAILCVASGSRGVCVTGSSLGTLLVWKNFKIVCNVKTFLESFRQPLSDVRPSTAAMEYVFCPKDGYPHKSPILAMWAVHGSVDIVSNFEECKENYSSGCRFITGDRDGVICVWRLVETHQETLRLVLLKKCNISRFAPKPMGAGIRSLCERGGLVLVGNSAGEIYEITEESIPFVESISPSVIDGLGALKVDVDNSTQVTVDLPANRVSAGHSGGELWGLCCHPFLPVFFSAGDDQIVKCWSLSNHQLLSHTVLPDKARSLDINPNRADDIAIGLNNGNILIWKVSVFLNPDGKEAFRNTIDPSLNGRDISNVLAAIEKDQRKLMDPTQWIQVVKYSFEGSFLAAGCHDANIYVYDVAKNYQLLHILKDHTANVSHLDFGVMLRVDFVVEEPQKLPEGLLTKTVQDKYDQENKLILSTVTTTLLTSNWESVVKDRTTSSRAATSVDICMRSTSNAAELMYWSLANGKRIQNLKEIKDTWWASTTCPYGWSTQGIWTSDDDFTDIDAVSLSHQYQIVPVLAVGDKFGRLRLFNYPCVTPGAPDKCYKGHTAKITSVTFSYDDSYCLTSGGVDRCIFVWSTDVQDEIRERKALLSLSSASANQVSLPTIPSSEENTLESLVDENFTIEKVSPTKGDEFTAVQPWKGAIREPTDWKEQSSTGLPPDASLELSFVYGYRGWDCRNNISFTDSLTEIAYHVAGTGIVLNTTENKQIINVGHSDDILCLAVHPAGHTIATGEIGKFPKILIWDAHTGVTIKKIKFHKKGVVCIAFSSDGSMLISCGMDDDRTVAIHDVQYGTLLGKGKAGRGVDVYCLSVSPSNTFATGGKNHVKFWELPRSNSPAGELSSKSGIYTLKSVTTRTVCSCAYLGQDAVTGMIDGSLLLWKERSNTKVVLAHKGAITAMTALAPSGAKGPGKGLDTGEAGIRILSGGKDGFVHMWDLQLNRIWSLNLAESTPLSVNPQIQALSAKQNQLIIGTKGGEIYEVGLIGSAETCRHIQGHFLERGEVWGLAVHPQLQRFVTAGDDLTVRLWDAKSCSQVSVVNVGSKCRALSFHPDGSQIAVALLDGNVRILSDDLQRQLFSITVASSWIQALTFSPNGVFLAVGSHDSIVYLLETKAYSCRAKFRGHHSYVTAVDFSQDSNRLQSTSGDYELLFWDTVTGKQIVSATELRDEKWASQTCTLGWSVQGIWPPGSDGTDVNAVDRSPNGQLLATGDDQHKVKLFRNPSCKERAAFKEYNGHSEHVMRVRFSSDGKFLYSVGGLDKAIMQFTVKY